MSFLKRRASTDPDQARTGRRLLTTRQTIAAVIGLLAMAALAGPVAAHADSHAQAQGQASLAGHQNHKYAALTGTTSHAGSSCGYVERLRALAAEQRRVLDLVGDLRVLRNQADVDRLAVPNPETGTVYSLLPHMYDSMKGSGFTVVNVGMGGPGKPILLLYRPNRTAANVLDPFGADFPYTLVGWGYVSPYVPGQPPVFADDAGLRCLVYKDWLVHERSVHPSDTWQNIVVPPAEQFHGQAAGETPPTAEECNCPVALNHGRFWDVHLWLTGTPVPSVSMLNPGKPIPGFDPVPGVGFFYPERHA